MHILSYMVVSDARCRAGSLPEGYADRDNCVSYICSYVCILFALTPIKKTRRNALPRKEILLQRIQHALGVKARLINHIIIIIIIIIIIMDTFFFININLILHCVCMLALHSISSRTSWIAPRPHMQEVHL